MGREPAGPWVLQLMVDDTDGEEWVYRRDPRIRRAVSTLAGPTSTDQLLVLAPEVQLLYKSHEHDQRTSTISTRSSMSWTAASATGCGPLSCSSRRSTPGTASWGLD
jgi:hypothetical protein